MTAPVAWMAGPRRPSACGPLLVGDGLVAYCWYGGCLLLVEGAMEGCWLSFSFCDWAGWALCLECGYGCDLWRYRLF